MTDRPFSDTNLRQTCMVHVLGHPDVPLDTARFPENAQVLNCRNFCLLLAAAQIPYCYYGVPGSRLPGTGQTVELKPGAVAWEYGNDRHWEYTEELTRAFATQVGRREQPETPTLVASLYGGAQSDADFGDYPVLEPMVGYDHCWAPYRVFPSYAHQHVIYAGGAEHVHETKWFDTVIPHFLDVDDYGLADRREEYAVFLGRDAPDKGVAIAREVCEAEGIPLRVVHTGCHGAAKAELLGRARAVLMPTVYVEPFGYVAVEAQLCGVPAITTDWGAFAETVEHGVTGFRCRTLAEFRRALRLADGLDPVRIRERAVSLYSLDAVLPAYVRYFDFVWQVHTNGGYYADAAIRWPDPCDAATDAGQKKVDPHAK